ncbi:MAG: ATP-binding cassette domain-containing protein [Actinomycetota bacterium]
MTMTAAQLILIVLTLGATAAILLSESHHQRRAARLVVGLAGLIYGRRRLEFQGELAMLQETTDDSGLSYAAGVFVAATVERVATRRPLAVDNVSKTLGTTKAVDSISLSVPGGTITALVGSNGAGKSTLINLITGIHRPDHGEIRFGGFTPDRGGNRNEIALVRHDVDLLTTMTVAENLSISPQPGRHWLISARSEHLQATRALQRIGATIDTRARISELSRGDRCLVSIARAVQTGCRLLVLDEPSTSLTDPGVARLVVAMDHLRREGVSIVFASHCLDHVFQVADRVAVLRDGRLVHEQAIAETDPAEVIRHIVGSDERIEPAG